MKGLQKTMETIKITFVKKEQVTRGAYVQVALVPKQKEIELVRLADGGRVLEVGVEKPETITRRALILLARKIVAAAKTHRANKLVLNFARFSFPVLTLAADDMAELLAMNFEMANFEYVKHKTPPSEGWNFVREIMITGAGADAQRGFLRGQIIGREVNACRALANAPAGVMTPRLLAAEAKKATRGTRAHVSVLGRKELERLKMGGVLGVSRGSAEEPQFIILEYKPTAHRDEKPIIFVGKGVTFDSGGINLKPSDGIYEMHMDMSGGAAVIHSVALAAKLGVKKNVIGLVPAVENMPSGSSYRPGDVLTSLSGRTIEVLNTDAEGRIILADAITYAKRYNPRAVVDVATLTGAAMAALGQRCSGLFANDKKFSDMICKVGEESGDYVWPLPLWDEYEEEIKGTFGDVANIGKTRYGGAITAAIFLHQFAKDLSCPWAHIDIAPRMTAVEGEHLAKGAAGAPVRLLIKLLEDGI